MVVNSTATPREDAGESSQERWRKIQSVHPALAAAGKFIDWQKYVWVGCNPRCGRSLRSGQSRKENKRCGRFVEIMSNDRKSINNFRYSIS